MEKEIHINWEGHFSYGDAIEKFNNKKRDYGIYQVYGTHTIYGINTLLYIGKATEQTLSQRICDHEEWFEESWFPHALNVYIGRLDGETPSKEIWNQEISQAEKLLILSHCPAMNASGLQTEIYRENEEYGIHVFNWGRCGLLLPEVSGKRFYYWRKADRHPDDDVNYYGDK